MAAGIAARSIGARRIGLAGTLLAFGALTVLGAGSALALPVGVTDRVGETLGADNVAAAISCDGEYLHSCLGLELAGSDRRAMRASRTAKRALDAAVGSDAVSRSLAPSAVDDRRVASKLRRFENQWVRGVAPSLETLAVPESSTGLLILFGLAGVAIVRKRSARI